MPLWAHSGRELFYVDGDRNLIAAQVATDPTFARGEQRVLFELGAEYLLSNNYSPFDIHPDDERFLMMRLAGVESASGAGQLIVVENWFEEVKQKMGH